MHPGPVLLRDRPDEHPGRAAAQGGRGDPGAFQRLPGGLQEEALLRVHRLRLTRRDAEGLRVEPGGLVEEAALAGGGAAGAVEAVQVPAPVLGEAADRVAAGVEQVPQLLGGTDAAGGADGRADDRDRLFRGAGRGRGPRCGRGGPGGGGEVVGEGLRGRVVEDQGGGQVQAGGGGEPGAQLDAHEGVEPQVAEGAFGPRRRRSLVREDVGGLCQDQREDGSRVAEVEALGAGRGGGCGDRAGSGGGRWRDGLRRASGRVRLLRPVVAALEGVGRQRDAPGVPHPGGGRPVDLRAADEQLGGGGQGGGGLGASGPEGRDGDDAVVAATAVGGAVVDGRREGRAGGELQEGRGAEVQRGPQAVVEPYGLAGVPGPVAGVQRPPVAGAADEPAGEVGDEGDTRDVVADGLGVGAEGVQHRVHAGRVEGVADPQLLGAAPGPRPVVPGVADGVGVAGEDHGAGPVDGGDAETAGVRVEQREDLVLGGLDREHRPAAGQLLHEPAPGGDEGGRVGQGERPGDVGGGQFADRVAEEQGGADAPVLEEADQGRLEGEEGGLGVAGAVEQGGPLAAGLGVQDLPHGVVEVGLQGRRDLVEGAGEDRLGGVQLAAGPGPLAALAGQQEADPAGRRETADRGVGGAAPGEGGEPGEGGGGVVGEDGGAVGEEGAGGGEGVGDVGERGVRVAGEVVVEPGGLGAEGVGGTGGEGEDGRGRRGAGRLRFRGVVPGRSGLRPAGGRGRFEDEVAVGAAHAEGADGGERRTAGVRPLLGPGGDAQVEPVERDGGVCALEVEAGDEAAVVEQERRLDQARDAGGAFQVADVGLDRPDRYGPAGRTGGAEHRAEGARLDGVADAGAGAVEFHVVDVGGVDARVGVGQAQELALGLLAGHGQGVPAAVVVDGAAPDDAEDPVAVGLGVGEAFEDDGGAALTAYVAVGPVVEGVAAAVGRERAEGVRRLGPAGGEVEVDASGEGDGGLAQPQAGAGEVDGDQGGGLGGVHGEAGAAQPERVRDAVGDHAAVDAGEGVRGGRGGGGPGERGPVVGHGAHEDARPLTAQPVGGEPGVLQGLPGQFEDEPLLGVDRPGLARGDPEEPGVESGDVLQVSGPAPGGQAPAGRGLADRVAAFPEEAPEGVRAGGAGQAAGEADHRDGLAAAGGLL